MTMANANWSSLDSSQTYWSSVDTPVSHTSQSYPYEAPTAYHYTTNNNGNPYNAAGHYDFEADVNGVNPTVFNAGSTQPLPRKSIPWVFDEKNPNKPAPRKTFQPKQIWTMQPEVHYEPVLMKRPPNLRPSSHQSRFIAREYLDRPERYDNIGMRSIRREHYPHDFAEKRYLDEY